MDYRKVDWNRICELIMVHNSFDLIRREMDGPNVWYRVSRNSIYQLRRQIIEEQGLEDLNTPEWFPYVKYGYRHYQVTGFWGDGGVKFELPVVHYLRKHRKY